MAVSAGILIILGGICACAPLFKRVSKSIERLLAIVGFILGIVVLAVAVDYALALNFLSSVISIPSPSVLSSSTSSYVKYFLPAMIVLGILLVSRPVKNIRWASLISLAVGLLVAYFLRELFPSLSATVLLVVFLIAALVIYTLLKFIEDLFKLVSSILAFTPIALAIGLINIYFGVLLLSVS
ncbi:MAG TPA: hypothetical protein VFE96_02065 [Candidatus Bathyarchaeia archaeon]|jgi:hypothetical protein|nr:hypothetical protein [Candidatus Bathyarchaeia archaeon]